MAEALEQGATDIITAGAQQSNHACQTAAAATAFGMKHHLMLLGGPPTHTGNQTLYEWLGAETNYLGDVGWEALRKASEAKRDELAAQGRKPYLIPVGGSTPLGALGYLNAALELLGQDDGFDRIYHAGSSGGTQAGLVSGLVAAGAGIEVRAVMVDEVRPSESSTADLANGALRLLDLEPQIGPEQLHCDTGHIGPGYAIPSDEGVEAICLLARFEGIFADPVYTGKALSGLIADAKRGDIGKGDRVLFWHTGGVVALFAEHFAPLARRCHN
jgi:L-cysteate sulfo-lyase